MNSPQKAVFKVVIFFSFLFITLLVGRNISETQIRSLWNRNLANYPQIIIARHYWLVGETEKAIIAYQNFQTNNQSTFLDKELDSFIRMNQSIEGKALLYFLQLSNTYLPILTYLILVFLFVFLGIFLSNSIRKIFGKPIIAFEDFLDYCGFGFQEDIHKLISNRIQEISWLVEKVGKEDVFITENLDLPIVGIISDIRAFDSITLLETALTYSVNLGEASFSKIVSSFVLWIRRPDYVIKGYFQGSKDNPSLRLILVNRKNEIEKSWFINFSLENSEDPVTDLLDGIIFPLISFFGRNLQTEHWDAIRSLVLGLWNYHSYRETRFTQRYIEKSIEILETGITLDPSYDLVKYNLGVIYLISGKYEKAKAQLKSVFETTSDDNIKILSGYLYGVSLYHISTDWAYEIAEKVFTSLLESKTKKHEDLILSALALTCAKNAPRNKIRRDDLMRLGISSANQVISSENSSGIALSNAYTAKGFLELENDAKKQALNLFNIAVKENSNNIQALLGIAQTFRKLGKNDQALLYCEKAALLSPHSEYPNYQIGNIFFDLGNYELAKNSYIKAPSVGMAHLNLGKIYYAEGDFIQAIKEFEEATKASKRLSEAWDNLAWITLELEDRTKIKEAVNYARRSVQTEKAKWRLWHRHLVLARALLADKQGEKAYVEINRAIELQPQDFAQTFFQKAEIEYNIGLPDIAKKTLETAFLLEEKGEWRTRAELLLKKILMEEKNNGGR